MKCRRSSSGAMRASATRAGCTAVLHPTMPRTCCSILPIRRVARGHNREEQNMAEISRVALFGKLNALGYRAIESASVFCKLRGNPYIELTHWFHQILQLQDSDLHRIIKHFGIDPAKLARDLTNALDTLPRGSTSVTDISSQVEETVERGWVYGSLLFNESQVRTGHLIVGMLKTPSLRNGLRGISQQFDLIKLDDLADNFAN